MLLPGKQVDANFFTLIHRVITEQAHRAPRDRRQPDRSAYQALARIALPRDEGVPPESEFFDVPCRDLTRRGFSFVLPYRPEFSKVVVCFGSPPEAIYIAARVVHCDNVVQRPDGAIEVCDQRAGRNGEGKPLVLVGCEFRERLHRS